MLRELRRGGFTPAVDRACDGASLRAALGRGEWDVVIADYRMPGFTGLDALAIVRAHDPNLPFILVSGTVGEEVAVEAMRAGAHDYVMKGSLTRLCAAVERELREADVRRARRRDRAAQAFLSRTGTVLVSELELPAMLARVAALVVPELADWCLVDVVGEEGQEQGAAPREREPIAVAHRDPAKVALVREWARRFPPDPAPPSRTALVDAPPSARGDAVERQALLGRLGCRAALVVPLPARGRSVGAITLVFDETRGADGADDLALAEELGRRVGLAVDNARLYAAARRAVALRDELIAVAAHELRTPVTTLELQLYGLERRVGREDADPSLAPRVGTARRQVRRLARLVENVLDVSRIEAGTLALHVERIDLAAAVERVVEEYRDDARTAGCEVTVAAPAPVVGVWDPAQLGRVVSNLLANALKFGARAPVELRVEAVEGRARLSVRDHGIGIPRADLERLFERFERATSIEHYGGLALGLFIARRIVERHGGTITVDSEPGAGTTFVVSLPLPP